MERPKNELILEAAFEIFSNKGFHGAKVEEIADRAGVGKGTIYEYFKNKVDLFLEMLVLQIDKYFSALLRDMPKDSTAIVQLKHIVRQHIIFNKGLQSIVNRFMIESGPSLDADIEIKQRMMETYRAKFAAIDTIIVKGITDGEFRKNLNPNILSSFFFGGLTGITNTMLMLKLELDPEEVANEIVDILRTGVLEER